MPLCSRAPLLVAAGLVVAAQTVGADRLPIRAVTTADGLPSDGVNCVERDTRGFLWFCTDEGLARFDGHTLATFDRRHGLNPAAVRSLRPARDGRYWVGATGGLFEFLPAVSRFRPVATVGDGRIGAVNAILEGPDGTLWIGAGTGLYRLPARSTDPRAEPVDIGLPGETENDRIVRALLIDEHGDLWVGAGSGLYRRRPGAKATRFTRANGLPVDEVWALALDARRRLWAGTRDGLCLVGRDDAASPHRVVERVYGVDRGLPQSNVKSLLVHGDRLWVGMTQSAVEVTVSQTGDLTVGPAIRPAYARAISRDASGNIWVGSATGALRLARLGFTTFTPDYGLATPITGSVFETIAGEVCATDYTSQAFACFDGRQFRVVRPRLPRRDMVLGWGWSQITLQDRRGEWWVPTGEGLLRYPAGPPASLEKATPLATYTTHDGLRSDSVFRLFEDSHSDLWIVTFSEAHNGISRWERSTGRVKTFGYDDGLPASLPIVRAVAEDRAGQIWIACEEGLLLRFTTARFSVVSPADDAATGSDRPHGYLRALLVDTKGRVWVGSQNAGLGRIDEPTRDTPTIKWYSTPDTLSSSSVTTIVEDAAGRLYVGGGRGVDRFDPQTGMVTHFTDAHGVVRGDFFGSLRDRRGALWFATREGPSRLIPEGDDRSTVTQTLITGLRVNGVPRPVSAIGESTIGELELEQGERQVQVDFVAPDPGGAGGVLYQHRLDGDDAGWSRPSEQRTITFAGLTPGAYRVLVRRVGPGQSGSSPAAAVAFRIKPPVWRRTWFIGLIVAGAAGVIWVLHRSRVARHVAVERVRTRIAADLHDDVGASLSRIAIQSEVLQRQTEGMLPDAQSALASIADHARAIADNLGDVVWSIDPRLDNLQQVIVRIRTFAAEVFDPRAVAWTVDATPDTASVELTPEQRRQVYLILKESLTNAARHSQATRVTVRIARKGNRLRADVIDDGTGLEPERSTSTDGHGRGLANMRARAESLRGRLVVRPGPEGAGTRVTLDVPLKRTA